MNEDGEGLRVEAAFFHPRQVLVAVGVEREEIVILVEHGFRDARVHVDHDGVVVQLAVLGSDEHRRFRRGTGAGEQKNPELSHQRSIAEIWLGAEVRLVSPP